MDLTALDFTGKTIWVTGAYQGIGRAIAEAFLARGGRVVGFDKKFTAPQGDAHSGGMREVGVDLARPAEIAEVMRRELSTNPRVDVLVNAAGIMHMGSLSTLSPESWQQLFDVNVTAVFHTLRLTAPVFKAQRQGAIVNIGSNAAHAPRTSMIGYGAAKAALASLSRTAALELAPFGVRCNMISPGSTDTPMQRALWSSDDDAANVIAGAPADYRLGIPLGKIATPRDIASLAVFLASELAGHIVMQDIVVDGGATLGS